MSIRENLSGWTPTGGVAAGAVGMLTFPLLLSN